MTAFRLAGCALVVLAVGGCAAGPGMPSDASPAAVAFSLTPGSPPPSWPSLQPSQAVVGGIFGGAGNQYIFDAVAYGDGFVTVGENFVPPSVEAAVWASADGLAWAAVEDPAGSFKDAEMDLVATTGERLVAVGRVRHGDADIPMTPVVWDSDDGHHWTRTAASNFMSSIVSGLVAGSGGFLAWGSDASGAQTIQVSADGQSWQTSTFGATYADGHVGGVAAVAGGWVAVGSRRPADATNVGGPPPPAEAWFSSDGVTWSPAAVEQGPALSKVIAGARGLLGIGARDCGGCVGPASLWRSSDGRAWQRAGSEPIVGAVYTSDGSRIVRYDQSAGSLDWSDDGFTWLPLAVALQQPAEVYGTTVGSHGVLVGLQTGPGSAGGLDETDAGVWFLAAR